MLEIGKLPNNKLETILNRFSIPVRSEVMSRPVVGEDCAVLDFSGDLCVVTTDPITGSDDETGTLAVHIACNDLASAGAEPVGLLITLLIPPGCVFDDIDKIMTQVKTEADKLNADIIGGHTEVTDAVNRIVISVTALGRVKKEELITTAGACIGDDIILTKFAGTEGTVILSYLFEDELKKKLGPETTGKAKTLMNSISVVKEGRLAAQYGASSMHDVTEGGVLGAVWELCAASGLGARIYKKNIPVLEETSLICGFLSIDPLRLISSGCMLITSKDGEGLLKLLRNSGVPSCIIGKITQSDECLLIDGNKVLKIDQPESDELYKARKMKGGHFNGGSVNR